MQQSEPCNKIADEVKCHIIVMFIVIFIYLEQMKKKSHLSENHL